MKCPKCGEEMEQTKEKPYEEYECKKCEIMTNYAGIEFPDGQGGAWFMPYSVLKRLNNQLSAEKKVSKEK